MVWPAIIRGTMPATQAQIDALTAQIAAAERQVTNGSQSVTYRSINELMTARDALQRELDAANPVKRSKQFRVYQSGRGYDK